MNLEAVSSTCVNPVSSTRVKPSHKHDCAIIIPMLSSPDVSRARIDHVHILVLRQDGRRVLEGEITMATLHWYMRGEVLPQSPDLRLFVGGDDLCPAVGRGIVVLSTGDHRHLVWIGETATAQCYY